MAVSDSGGSFPVAAIDRQGRAFVTWVEGGTVRLVTTNEAGEFGAASLPLSQATASSPFIALDSDGNAVIVWIRSGVVEYLTRSNSGTFSPPAGPQPLSDAAGGAGSLHATIGPAGDIGLVWTRAGNIEARYRKAGDADFGPVQIIGNTGTNVFLSSPRIAIDGLGRATAIWNRRFWDGTNSHYSLQTADRTRTIPFGSGTSFVTYVNESIGQSDLGVDQAGNAIAAWYHNPGGSVRIEAASKPTGGSFGAVQLVSASAGSADYPEVAVNGKGDVGIVWNRYIPAIATRVIEAKYRPAGESFDSQPVSLLSSEDDYSDFPDIAMDGDGNAVAFWGRRNNTANPTAPFYLYSHRAAGFDAVAPKLASVSIPGRSVAESEVGMSASAFDQWSSPAISWSFGDGSSTTGRNVTHTYTTDGTYTVTVTATDSVGNVTTATRTIEVEPKPVPPPRTNADGDPVALEDGDCADNDPRRYPGNGEIPNNNFDEDCNGTDLKARVQSPIDAAWKWTAKSTSVKKLRVRSIPRNATLTVTCKKGRKKAGCPFKRKKLAVAAGGDRALTKLFRKKGTKKPARLKVGVVIGIRVEAPTLVGQLVKFKVRSSKAPATKESCIPAAGGKATACSSLLS